MKKIGFTLAEVLITLGIIGVVAALTAPALVQNAGSAQTGPKLAKAVSTFETANENMLTQEGLTNIMTVGTDDGKNASQTYGDRLTNYMKMSLYEAGSTEKYSSYATNGIEIEDFDGSGSNGSFIDQATTTNSAKYLAKDGPLYSINIDHAPYRAMFTASSRAPVHKRLCGIVAIDINGLGDPNRIGKDIFGFFLYADGSLRPIGSTNCYEYAYNALTDAQNATMTNNSNRAYHWKDGQSLYKCDETTVGSGIGCAGSIFENNLKVIYQ